MIKRHKTKVVFFSIFLTCIFSGCLPFTTDYSGWFFFYGEDGRRIEDVHLDIAEKIRKELRAIASEFGFKEDVDDWSPDISFFKNRNIVSAQYKNLNGADALVTIYVSFDYKFFITLRDFDNDYETELVSHLKTEIVQRLTKIGFKKKYIRFVRKKYTSWND